MPIPGVKIIKYIPVADAIESIEESIDIMSKGDDYEYRVMAQDLTNKLHTIYDQLRALAAEYENVY